LEVDKEEGPLLRSAPAAVNDQGDSEDKGIQKPGENIEHVFTKPGIYKERCNIHSTMKLDVTVQ